MDGHADALSRAERHRLRDIERGLVQDDPDFVAEFEDVEPAVAPARRFPQGKNLVLLVSGIAGIASLAVGLTVALPIVGVAGFAAVVLVLTRLVGDDGWSGVFERAARRVRTAADDRSKT